MSASRRRRLALLILGGLVLLGGAAIAVLVAVVRHPMPEGKAGPEAEALAQRVMRAADVAAWEPTRTGAVRWNLGGREDHLWDRRRRLDRVRWKDVEVLVDLGTQRGLARRGGQAVTGPEGEALVKRAYARWINDSFWLNPLAKLYDPGTSRLLVHMDGDGDGDGGEALLLRYSSGGLTPGDSYLWIPGADGLPRAWRMWVSVVPVGGIEVSWEGWITLSTGARVATVHRFPGFTLRLSDVAGAATLEALEGGPDPFAALVAAPR